MKTIVLFFVTMIFSCNKLSDIEYEDFTLYDKYINTNQIKLNGIYYLKRDGLLSSSYLWEDGSFYNIFDKNNLESNCLQINNLERDSPFAWGFFDIDNGNIKIQRINSVSIQFNSKYQIDNYEGVLLNDTTFVVNKYIDYNEKIESLNDTFRFHHCINKPDSINVILRNIER